LIFYLSFSIINVNAVKKYGQIALGRCQAGHGQLL
jgi:hypothetical protein